DTAIRHRTACQHNPDTHEATDEPGLLFFTVTGFFNSITVSYTQLRAHETTTALWGGVVVV
ncbi:hypothetical protein ACVGWG_10180, partial [Enterobacter asburiae]